MSFEVEGKGGVDDLTLVAQSSSHAAAKYRSRDEARAGELDAIAKLERSENRFSHLYARGENVRQTIFMLLDEPESGLLATIISSGILALIFASSTCFVVETVETVKQNAEAVEIMHAIETACMVTFTVEYLARVLTCSQRPREDQSVVKYLLAPMSLVDLISIAPFYIEMLIGAGNSGMAVVRVLRMSRIFRCVVCCTCPMVTFYTTDRRRLRENAQCFEGGHLR